MHPLYKLLPASEASLARQVVRDLYGLRLGIVAPYMSIVRQQVKFTAPSLWTIYTSITHDDLGDGTVAMAETFRYPDTFRRADPSRAPKARIDERV